MITKRLFPIRTLAALALLAAGGAARAQTPSALAEWQFSGGVPLRAMFMPEIPTWDYDIGAAVIEQPKYEGSKDYQIQPGPTVNIRYKDLAFISTGEGLGWNVFHGNASPPRRRGYLHQMIELVASDAPDVVCLQELPVWALPLIDNWSGMQRFHAVARPPWRIGPLAGALTRLNAGLLRSALTGQANAILVRAELPVEELNVVTQASNVIVRDCTLEQANEFFGRTDVGIFMS